MKRKTMPDVMRFLISLFVMSTAALLLVPFPLMAQDIPVPEKKQEIYSVSGLPIPRFVSLAKDLINLRSGPGQEYPIRWVIKKKGLPVEIILEYDHWRKIRDYEGSEGWVHKSLLSGKRTAFIIGSETVLSYDKNSAKNSGKASVIMMLEPMSMVDVEKCDGAMCRISVSTLSGWIERKSIWGVYETENFD